MVILVKILSSRPGSLTSDSVTGRNICSDLEREIVNLDPVYTSTCKSDLLEQELLVSPSGEVILNFKDPATVTELPVRIAEIWQG